MIRVQVSDDPYVIVILHVSSSCLVNKISDFVSDYLIGMTLNTEHAKRRGSAGKETFHWKLIEKT